VLAASGRFEFVLVIAGHSAVIEFKCVQVIGVGFGLGVI